LATLDNGLEFDIATIKKQFHQKKPSMVIFSHVSNVLGLVAPVYDISELAKQFESIVVVDGAQSCGVVDINVNQFIDYYVFAGHKTLLAPFGVAGFICNKNTKLSPLIFGGTGIDSANLNMPSSVPERFEAGSPNLMAIAGLYFSLLWRKENFSYIQKKEEYNFKMLKEILEGYDFIKVINVPSKCVSILSCKFDGFTSDEAARLLADKGVSVRSGLHCAPLAHKQIGSFPEGLIRFSISCFTDDEDFTVLKDALTYIGEEI
jgi:selenocysteine lyase/cysteine desulfurase